MSELKTPADRAHLWERPTRVDEQADLDRQAGDAAALPSELTAAADGDLEFPRHVHKPGGVSKVVGDVDAYTAARADGWSDTPSPAEIEALPPSSSFDEAQVKQLQQENADLRAQLAEANKLAEIIKQDLEAQAAARAAIVATPAAAATPPVAPAKKSWMGGTR